MQASIKSAEGLERRLTLEVPAERVVQEVEQRLKSMAGRIRMAGFRPGKVPVKVVKQQYGAQVRQEVETDLTSRAFYEAVQRENLRPAGAPKLELSASGDDKLSFTATFEVYPDVKVQIPSGFTVNKTVTSIADGDVDTMVEKLRKQRAAWENVDRAAQDGDRVTIDFLGRINGEAFAGGEGKSYPLVLGSKRFIAGFEEQVVGAKLGEHREVTVTFPEAYQNQELAGKAAVFSVTVQRVEGPKLPSLEDVEFLSSLGVREGGLAALRQDVRDSMQRELDQTLSNQVKQDALDKLLAANPIALPSALVETEIQQMADQARQSMGMQGTQPVTDEIRTVFVDGARRRVALGLLVGELVRAQGFRADPERVRARIEALAASYEDPAAVLEWYQKDRSRLSGVEALVLEDQVIEWLLSQAKIESVNKDFDVVMAESGRGQ